MRVIPESLVVVPAILRSALLTEAKADMAAALTAPAVEGRRALGTQINISAFDAKLNERNLADSGRAFYGTWLVGLLVAIAIVSAISTLYPDLLQKHNLAPPGGYVAGSLGLLAGLVCGALRASPWFRTKPALSQRRILSFGMIVAVEISVASIILYYSSGRFLRSVIGAGYFSMLIGYVVPYVMQVEK